MTRLQPLATFALTLALAAAVAAGAWRLVVDRPPVPKAEKPPGPRRSPRSSRKMP
jgi:hypothetical protein